MAVFSKANKVETAKPKASKKTVEEVAVENLETFAAICKVSKALKTVQETYDANIKHEVVDTFIGMGVQLGRRPENFKGVDGAATASMQLKTLSTRSNISQESKERLEAEGVPLKQVDEVACTFILNPKYADNEDIMSKMEAALSKLGLPEDLFLHQEQKKYVVDGDRTMDALFALKNKALIAELLPLVATTAIKPTTEMSMREAVDHVMEFLEDVSESVED